MSVINILSPHIADLIAAGEVVERPASVVKELSENSFDAGARKLTIEIRNGGATYIRVTDDGCGMSPEDAGIAFLRHATSKLHDEHGLEAISTMGFRGEALAAISSVSNIELNTRRADAAEGTRVLLSAGDIDDMYAVGCPCGTDIIVRDLFFNTPARQKFMKSDRSEASACQQAAVRCALSRPDIAVRFIRDGEEVFSSPGNGSFEECAYSVLGRDNVLGTLGCAGCSDELSLSGIISSPSACRGNRSGQYFFCNSRFIKSTVMQTAVEQAYRNSMLTGRYPSCVLYLTIPAGSVDVNVHPAKTEVKFSDEKRIFDLVYHSVLEALSSESAPGPVIRSHSVQPVPVSQVSASQASDTSLRTPSSSGATGSGISSVRVFHPMEGYQTRMDMGSRISSSAESDSKKNANPVPDSCRDDTLKSTSGAKNVENYVQNVDNPPLPDHKIAGEIFKKYIIVELEDSVILIDKHAAHERMIFDKLKAQQGTPMCQSLLLPVPLHLEAEDCEVLAKYGDVLTELGYEIEALDSGNYLVRSVPADMYAADVAPSIEEICSNLRSGNLPDPTAVLDTVLHTVACKAAIKAGWDTSSQELERIAQAVLSGAVLYCPHGRPVSASYRQADFDRIFKRIL